MNQTFKLNILKKFFFNYYFELFLNFKINKKLIRLSKNKITIKTLKKF